jgi:hypothetical protein
MAFFQLGYSLVESGKLGMQSLDFLVMRIGSNSFSTPLYTHQSLPCPGRFGDTLIARRDQRRLERFDVIWKGFTTRIHAQIESQILADDSSKNETPATILRVPDESYDADSANRFHRARGVQRCPRG